MTRRKLLWRRIVQSSQRCCHRAALILASPAAAIIPWIVGDERRALDLARALQQEEYFRSGDSVSNRGERSRPASGLRSAPSHSALQIASLGDAIGRLARQEAVAPRRHTRRWPRGWKQRSCGAADSGRKPGWHDGSAGPSGGNIGAFSRWGRLRFGAGVAGGLVVGVGRPGCGRVAVQAGSRARDARAR